MIERKVGEIFKCQSGKTVMCVSATNDFCKGCVYAKDLRCGQDKTLGRCSASMRSDNKRVIFIKVESDIVQGLEVLEKLANKYPGKTIEYILEDFKNVVAEKYK